MLNFLLHMFRQNPEAPPWFRFGGDILGVGLEGGPRAEPPDARNLWKFQKKEFQEICKKWIILGDFSKKLK